MAQFLWIPWRLPRLNEALDQRVRVFRKKSGAARASKSLKPATAMANGYSVLKKQWERDIWLLARARGFSVLPGCWDFTYLFVESDCRTDPSNISSVAVKFIEDALQGSKRDGRHPLMAGDGWGTVHAIYTHFNKTTEAVPITGVLLGVANQLISKDEMMEQAGRMYYAERVSRRVNTAAAASTKGAQRGGLPRRDQSLGEAPTEPPPAPGARVRTERATEDGCGAANADSGER